MEALLGLTLRRERCGIWTIYPLPIQSEVVDAQAVKSKRKPNVGCAIEDSTEGIWLLDHYLPHYRASSNSRALSSSVKAALVKREILGLAHAMFGKLRADIADDSNSSRRAGIVAKPLQGSNSVVQGVAGIGARDNPIADQCVEQRCDDGRARVT